jgi:hypothetical protein
MTQLLEGGQVFGHSLLEICVTIVCSVLGVSTLRIIHYRSSSEVRATDSCPFISSIPSALLFTDCTFIPFRLFQAPSFGVQHGCMCRMYNDYGSVARDKAERNLNSVNFPEFETRDGHNVSESQWCRSMAMDL